MSDFPGTVLPLHVHSFSSFGVNPDARVLTSSSSPSTITWVANQAVYMPFNIPWDYPVNRVYWVNGSTIGSTNVDMGIYTLAGVKVYSTGSTAMAGVSLTQYVAPATPFVLSAGRYYLAWTCSNTTSRAFGSAQPTVVTGPIIGLLSQASALPLPATATFARYIATGFVICGVTRTSSGF